MKFARSLLLLCFVCGAVVNVQSEDDDVVVLTDSTFDDYIASHKFVLAEFYAPWCGHCKSLAPEYSAAAGVLKEGGHDVTLAKIDATVESDLAKRFEIQGFPTLKWIVDGEASDYGGPRDATGIQKWVMKRVGPPCLEVESVEQAQEALEGFEEFVIAYFSKYEGEGYEAYQTAAAKSDLVFMQTTSSQAAAEVGLTAPGIAVFRSSIDPHLVRFEGPMTPDAISLFTSVEVLPFVAPFDPEYSEKIFGSGVERQLIVLGKSPELKEIKEDLEAIGAAYRGKVIVVTVDTVAHKEVADFFSATGSGLSIYGFLSTNGTKYHYEGETTKDGIADFAEKFIANQLKPFLKSEPTPETNDGPVTIVTGNTFHEIALAEDKDVLLEVYAPWCGHCKALEPIYKKLGKKFKNIESMVIAKMDGVANEVEGLNIEGFPTIVFFPAGGSFEDQVSYDGERTVKEFTRFLKKQAAIPFSLKKSKEESQPEVAEGAAGAKDEL